MENVKRPALRPEPGDRVLARLDPRSEMVPATVERAYPDGDLLVRTGTASVVVTDFAPLPEGE